MKKSSEQPRRNVQKDNPTINHKVALRRRALDLLRDDGITDPAILECYGGNGEVWKKVYSTLRRGVVFDVDPNKAFRLAKQRPSWSVFEGDCVAAIEQGIGDHLAFDLIDIDPYGSHFPALRAFLTSKRPRKDRFVTVINDGQRQAVQINLSWKIPALKSQVAKHGNNLYPIYREVCEDVWREWADELGYAIPTLYSFYAGDKHNMTMLLGVWEKLPDNG